MSVAERIFSDPALVMQRLETIEADLATVQNELEDAGRNWFKARKERAGVRATAFVQTEGTDTARRLQADKVALASGWEEEADWEILREKRRLLEDRANIGMAILKAQGRAA